MRISTIQAFNVGIRGMTDAADQSVKTQSQISSGKRVQTPADDPVSSARILQLNQDKARRDQFISNIDNTTGRLELEESQLHAINQSVIRVRELTVQAGNGAYTLSDRKALADELEVRLQELADLMNTRDTNGEYMFAGFQGNVQPFQKTDGGTYVYRGDDGQRFVNVSSSTTVAVSDSGKGIFVDIPSARNTFFTRSSEANTASPAAHITQGVIVDQDAYDAFYPEDMIITFNDPNDMTTLVPPQAAQPNFTITHKSDGRIALQNVPFSSGDHITFNGVDVQINGDPAVGDRFTIESTGKQSLLATVGRLVEGLRQFDNTQQSELDGLLERSLTNLDNAQTNVLKTQSQIGARINTLDSVKDVLTRVDITSQEILSELQDLDYAEAVSRLSFETFILQAAQQSYSKVANLSLFNFL